MRVVIALGGNALLRRGQPPELRLQRENAVLAAATLAEIAQVHEVVVTHGNGPQVGLLALQAECDPAVTPYPLDVLDAETEGQIGYLLEQELRNRLPRREVATLLTMVEVDPADPAFQNPSKPIGPGYPAAEAERLSRERGWNLLPDGDRVRRAVPSPEPRRLLELTSIRLLLEAGVLVICAGGGGIPVARAAEGTLRGMEAVIDKDLASALLATELRVDALLLLTDVDAVRADWRLPTERALQETTPEELRRLEFAAGSMGPKVEAVCRFVEQTGGLAGIGRLEDGLRILERRAGTTVTDHQARSS